MKHHIIKQVIEISVFSKKDAYRLQHLVSDRYWNSITMVLEKAFDKVTNDYEVIQIDRLEIDLGVIDEKDIELNRWNELLLKKLTEQLRRIIREPAAYDFIRIQSGNYNVVQQWMYYMRRGQLPDNLAAIGAGWHAEVLSFLASDYAAITEVRELILHDAVVRERIILQHDNAFIIGLLECLSSRSQKEMTAVIGELTGTLTLNVDKKPRGLSRSATIETSLWCATLAFAAVKENILDTASIIRYLLTRPEIKSMLNPDLPVMLSKKSKWLAPYLKEISKQQQKNIHRDTDENIKQREIATEPLKEKMEDRKEQEQRGEHPATPGLEKINKADENDYAGVDEVNAVENECLYIGNAGLILLHPFLPRFFQNLGLLNEERFIGHNEHQKALYLLHYLSTGDKSPAEHLLVTPKIICNYPLHQPVDGSLILAAEETAEADELLLNVIGQWEILGNSTIDGLREGFLQRNGKYNCSEGKAVMFVEPNAIDMLLDHLPWSMSMIKLPWMNDILWVEWR